MWMRDNLQELFTDNDFAGWYPEDGRPGVPPARLALVCVLQYAEDLTDRQAARAVACRIDWKYCLGMDLAEPGFDHSVLSEFRDRLAEGDRADRLLALMVERLVSAGLVKRRGMQRTDSTHVLAAVRKLSRIELVGETMRVALEAVANVDDRWLEQLLAPEWAQRYGQVVGYQRIPNSGAAAAEYVLAVGEDGVKLLDAVYREDSPTVLSHLPQVEALRQVWVQQYWYDRNGQLQWRQAKASKARRTRDGNRNISRGGSDDAEAATVPWSSTEIVTPHDPQARFSHKAGKTAWIGYKDHQTETCDGDVPNVIVHVVTTAGPEQDFGALPVIHDALAGQDMLPSEHLVDAGYVTPQAIYRANREHGVTMIGPVRADLRGGRERPGFAKEDFHIDWDSQTVTCPQGVTSPRWKPTTMDLKPGVSVLFRRADCRACTTRDQCTGNTGGRGRHLLLLPKPLQEIQNMARIEQKTPQWQKRYALRAGCEATVSETVHAHGLRHCRYRGLAKTHVQHVLTAAGTNIVRLAHQPPASKRRRPSHFQRLCRQILSDLT